MSKPVLFDLLLTTLCMIFEANGLRIISSPENSIRNQNDYEYSPLRNNMYQYEPESSFENQISKQSKNKMMTSENQYDTNYRDSIQAWGNPLAKTRCLRRKRSSYPSLQTNDLYDLPNTGLLTKHDFSFPNGKGSIIRYSNRWDTSNNDISSFNMNLKPMADAIMRNSQLIASQNQMMDAIVQHIMNSLSQMQNNGNYPSEIQENNNDPTINKKPNDPTDLANNLIDSNTNNQEQKEQNQQQQHQKQQQQQQQQNKPTNRPVSSASSNLSEEQISEIRNKVLERSNYYRQKHDLPEFTIDDELNNLAQNWAENIGRRSKMEHRPNNKYGENIYARSEMTDLGNKAVDGWYNELKDFQLGGDENSIIKNTVTHHMTQLLWNSSLKMGVGVSLGADGMYYVVANYDPAGNVVGEFMNNLPEITKADIDVASTNANTDHAILK